MAKRSTKPQAWSASWTFVMVAGGVTVGFGNIWGLPVLSGEYGGAGFWWLYFIAMVLIGIPMLLGQMLLGAAAGSEPVQALRSAARSERLRGPWSLAAWLAGLAALVVLPLYAVVAGWSFSYIAAALQGQLTDMDVAAAGRQFAGQVGDFGGMAYWSSMVVALCSLFSALGVNRGLGLVARLLVPGFFGLFVAVAWYSQHLGEMHAALQYLFVPNWHAVDLKALRLIVSQVVFSLSLGSGVMVAIAAYAPVREDLPVTAMATVLINLFAALLAGYVLLPLVFAANIAPDGGVALLFISVPVAFGNMINGAWMAAAIYGAMLLAAVTSITALMEFWVAVACQRWRVPRALASLGVGAIVLALTLGCHASLAGQFGQWPSMFVDFDTLSRLVLPAIALLIGVYVAWRVYPSMTRTAVAGMPPALVAVWLYTLRWVAIPAVAVVLGLNVYDTIAGH